VTPPVVGMIFECGPMGADKAVCEYLAAQLRPGLKLTSRTMDNKPNLLANAAKVAASLLLDGCERVLIVWDLRPAWPVKGNKPCRAHERQALLDQLAKEGLADKPIYLICVEQELESWLLADEVQLAGFLSRPAHAYDVRRVRNPDQVIQPKAAVINHFKSARGWRYEDRVHACKVVSFGSLNLARLRRSESFTRFELKLTS
jgi:hypothetical protein